ncbi:uncharacterized protein LOC118502899 [Anopheles stephensi]|uniref:Putative 11.9 kDa salivary protein n=1 Tax=Anopheles stephensi TaxID=30069 RepID=Q8I6P5_ANOST|nr:uncharacterized protein LOC118502899 [Anopheles stephensi]AAO06836.1 putative 11.9 kDa salivary protein [Anopheles stephensi]
MYAQLLPVLLVACVLLGSVASAPPSTADIIFPVVDDLAIGDPCTIEPSPDPTGIQFAREGICQRVRDCPTFIPRIIREPFDIRRDVCYFEVHDPVVCCVELPVSAELVPLNSNKRLSLDDLDDTNLIH